MFPLTSIAVILNNLYTVDFQVFAELMTSEQSFLALHLLIQRPLIFQGECFSS